MIRSLSCLLLGSVLALSSAQAQRTVEPPLVVGDYAIGRGSLKVTVDGRRIEVLATDDSSVAVIFLDAASVRMWLDTATTFVTAKVKTTEWTEFSTPPLRHRDPSIESYLRLTREVTGRQSSFYLTAMLDPKHLTLLRLSPMEARILLSALSRAVEEERLAGTR